MTAKTNALAEARKVLKKVKGVDFKNRRVSNPHQQFPHVSTGSIIVNHLIGGTIIEDTNEAICPGVPRGRIIEVYGPESSGKTTLTLHVIAQAQKSGGCATFIDFENALYDGYAQALGVEYHEDKLDVWIPYSLEEGWEILRTSVESNVDVVVVDSVSAMVPQKVLEGELTKEAEIGLQARRMSQYLPQLTNWLRNSSTTVIFCNQIRTNIKINKYAPGPLETTSGGNALKFYSSVRLKMKKDKQEVLEIKDTLTGKKKKKPIGTYTTVSCIKNKLDARQGDYGTVFIRFGKGIDNIRTILDIAIERRIVIKSGSWYDCKPKDAEKNLFHIQGKEQVQHLFKENPEIYEIVKNKVLEKMGFEGTVEETGANEFEEGEIITIDSDNVPIPDSYDDNEDEDDSIEEAL